MKILYPLLPFCLVACLAVAAPESPSGFNVKNYGAAGDGKALDHEAINRAIAAASDAGGGTVVIPAGTYLCFSIHLRSHVTIRFEQGATILAADPAKHDGAYDLAEPFPDEWTSYQDFGHRHFHNSLFWGENLDHVEICGPGLIHGKGLSRGDSGTVAQEQTKKNPSAPKPPKKPGPRAYPNDDDTLVPGIGNKSIGLKNCRNVILRDFSILHGGHFGILATGVDNLTIDGLRIDTNRDGMDIDSCRNVTVSNCMVNSPVDDAICLKSSYALGTARATENVTITNCIVSGDYIEGTMLDGTWRHFPPEDLVRRVGRIKLGTESNGGFKNIAITNCVFDGCNGLAIETVDGGVIEDVVASNLVMRDITASPIFIRLGARMRGPSGAPVGAIRRVQISNVTVSRSDWRYGSIISGIPGHPIEDLQISNVRGVQDGGGAAADAATMPPEQVDGYPDPWRFGTIPSWGFYIRHAVDVEMHHVAMSVAKEDQRPFIMLDDVNRVSFDHVDPLGKTVGPLFRLRKVTDFRADHCGSLPDTVIEQVEEKLLP